MQERPIKVVLIGAKEAKKPFVDYINREAVNRNAGSVDYKTVLYNGYEVQVWDMVGAERFRSTLPIYLKDVDVIILLTPGQELKNNVLDIVKDKKNTQIINFDASTMRVESCLTDIVTNVKRAPELPPRSAKTQGMFADNADKPKADKADGSVTTKKDVRPPHQPKSYGPHKKT